LPSKLYELECPVNELASLRKMIDLEYTSTRRVLASIIACDVFVNRALYASEFDQKVKAVANYVTTKLGVETSELPEALRHKFEHHNRELAKTKTKASNIGEA
jgi:hypothetical protein